MEMRLLAPGEWGSAFRPQKVLECRRLSLLPQRADWVHKTSLRELVPVGEGRSQGACGLRIPELQTSARTSPDLPILQTHAEEDTSLIRLPSPWPVIFLLSFLSTLATF